MANYVYDYETLSNCFIGVFEETQTDNQKIFKICSIQNDIKELIEFLDDCRLRKYWHISYNGNAFDAQITQFILLNKSSLLTKSGEDIAFLIYKQAQNIINRQNNNEFQQYSEREFFIQQIDVFKLNHWDNPAKSSSLKWIQYSMDWTNLLDMPIHHTAIISTKEEVDTIINYCINDVKSTKEIMIRSKELIQLRQTLSKSYNLTLYSASEPKLSKEIFLDLLSKNLDVKKVELRQLRTFRKSIKVSNIILPHIKFNNLLFNQLLSNFNNLIIDPLNTKNAFKYTVKHNDLEIDFGLGGIHGTNKPGIYESDDDMIIMSSDVASFYPNLAIMNNWSPAHLPKNEFCRLYSNFFTERKKIPKSDPRNYTYKIILNSTYGLSNDKNSFLYDPEFTMKITINGQLLLVMLYEKIFDAIPECKPVMINTDGIEIMIPRKYTEKYLEICQQWEKENQLTLEHSSYQKVVLADVNNYIAIYNFEEVSKEDYKKYEQDTERYVCKKEGNKYYCAKTKCKGRFEFLDLPLHKNKSYLIIRKALYNYFVYNIKPEDYIKSNKNIFDWCAGKKIKGDWFFSQICHDKGKVEYKKLQNTLRYFIAKKGCKILKINKTDNRETQIEAGKWMIREYNYAHKLSWEDYDIDYSYYLDAIHKEIANIEKTNKQLKLLL